MANSKGKCSACKKYFPRDDLRITPAGKFCSPLCLSDYAVKNVSKLANKHREDKKKERRKETRAMRTAMLDRDLSHQKEQTQKACNKFIRLRDQLDGCISCGTRANVQYCAGHYYSVGSRGDLRYHPMNIHKQCNQYCNMRLSANKDGYRPAIIKKIGQQDFDSLTLHRNIKYTIEDLKIIRAYYQRLIKHLESKLVEFAA